MIQFSSNRRPSRLAETPLVKGLSLKRIVDPSPEEPYGVPTSLPPDGGKTSLFRDPDQVPTLMHADFRLATTQIMAELFNQQPLVVVTGEAGLGKSLLLREVGRVLRAAEWRVADEMQIEAILERPAPGPVAVLIDGANRISPSQMQHLLRLKNLAIVLALPDPPTSRIPFCAPIRLKPMSADASAQFVRAWFQQTGTKPDLLNRDAVAHLVERSKGIPRHLASLLHELAKPTNSSVQRRSRTDVDEAARRLGLPVDPAPPFEHSSATTPGRPKAEPHPGPALTVAPQSFERDPGQRSIVGFRRLLPTNLGSAALTGLLCGIGAAIIGLMLQDLLTVSRDDTSDNRAAHTMPSGAPPALSPSGTPARVQGEAP